jgi:hypothetical protein
MFTLDLHLPVKLAHGVSIELDLLVLQYYARFTTFYNFIYRHIIYLNKTRCNTVLGIINAKERSIVSIDRSQVLFIFPFIFIFSSNQT